MIKYRLVCKECDLFFDSWFASSQEYEKLKNKKFLSCHNCNSKQVEKSLMAPKLINKNSSKNISEDLKFKRLTKKLKNTKNLLKIILTMWEKIFHMRQGLFITIKKKKKRGIYGSASFDEIKELRDEGIETEVIPWLEDKNN